MPRHPNADNRTWTQITQAAPAYFSASYPSRSRGVFGRNVFQKFEAIEKQLLAKTRTAWVRLIHDLCGFPLQKNA